MPRPKRPDKPTPAQYQASYRQRVQQRENVRTDQSMAARELAMQMRVLEGKTVCFVVPEPDQDPAAYLRRIMNLITESVGSVRVDTQTTTTRAVGSLRSSRFVRVYDNPPTPPTAPAISSGPTEDGWKAQEADNARAHRATRNAQQRARRAAQKST